GDSADNPDNQASWADSKTSEVLGCTRAALTRLRSDRSDVFGALGWAANVLPRRATTRRIVLLSDDINTTEGCNLTGRDISTAGREVIARDCGTANYHGLAGSDVWLAGIGLSTARDSTATVTPSTLLEFWPWFIASHGGAVS